MSTPAKADSPIRFGTFEVDLLAGELRKADRKIRIQEQPFRILVLLLEQPGEVVRRDDIIQSLWPDGTFVDYEHSVNTAIRKLREALGDDPDSPCFVETLPRRGYRFIAPVEKPEQSKSDELQAPAGGQTNRRFAGGWKIGIAVGSVVSLIGLALVSFRAYDRASPPTHASALEVIPLTALPGREISPTFSPDGSQVAFGWDGENNGAGFDLYVKVIGTDKPLRLTNHPAGWLGAAWAPDGRSIAVHRIDSKGENAGIFLVPALGGPEQKLVSQNDSGFGGAAVSWSPDGRYLAFTVQGSATVNSDRLFLLSLDTLERKPVETGCSIPYEPAFSPNGETLAYVCRTDAAYFSLNLKDFRTGKNTQLWRGSRLVSGVVWTHDGARIVFSTGSPIITEEGGDLWQITPGQNASPEKVLVGHDATSLAFSSPSQELAYEQVQGNANIWRVDLAGAKTHTRMLAPATRDQYAPIISPDGRRVAFVSKRSGFDEIWVGDSEGGNDRQLSSFGDTVTGTPRWAPDSRQIVFDSRVGGEANVYVVDANGGVPRKLETGTRMNSLPSWSHDGKWIYFASGPTNSSLTIWRVPAEGGRAKQLTKTPSGMLPLESSDGQFVYFVRWADKVRLWRIRTDGSDEKMLDAIPPLRSTGYEWWPGESGIYFWAYPNDKAEVDFLDLRTLRIRRVYMSDKPPAFWRGGLSVSPDAKWLVYSRVDQVDSDLMLVKNFH
jgi:Tol biopolymer transport system component/DNA-binding winged helix-turn-helix (wHTH) protein